MKKQSLNTIPQRQLPEKSQHILPVLKQLKQELQKLYGKRLMQLILYGSYARGDFKEFSDVDILVILDEMESPGKEIRSTSDITHRYLMNNDLIISLLPTNTEHFNHLNLGIYMNVRREGIVI